MDKKIRILIADDHKLIRETWTFLLNIDPRFEVVGECKNGNECFEKTNEMRPDLVMMDINMPELNGFDATKLIKSKIPNVKIIGISMHALPAYAKKLMALGANGYVTKNSSRDEMVDAILTVMSGKKYICAEIKDIIVEQEVSDEDDRPNIGALTDKELEVLRYIKEGLSSKELAIKWEVSVKTIETHRYNILKKLNQKNTTAAINLLVENGVNL
jgi:DNA-binding NarL/FixJ family response regulator